MIEKLTNDDNIANFIKNNYISDPIFSEEVSKITESFNGLLNKAFTVIDNEKSEDYNKILFSSNGPGIIKNFALYISKYENGCLYIKLESIFTFKIFEKLLPSLKKEDIFNKLLVLNNSSKAYSSISGEIVTISMGSFIRKSLSEIDYTHMIVDMANECLQYITKLLKFV